MTYQKLFHYYKQQSVLPTFGNLEDEAALARYAENRRRLFTDKLQLPPAIFRDVAMIEFGPDSGENATVFARWGARMTLVEPNPNAHDHIRAYFNRFGLSSALQDVVQADVEGFAKEEPSAPLAEVIDAEGFVYTIQPTEKWLNAFARLLRPDGFAIVSYYERCGAFFELALRAIHTAAKALSGSDALVTAWALYETKWKSIPHTRKFESWVMDVLENPFVRLKYFLSADALCKAAQETGFSLYSSWPGYRAPLEVYWHKHILSPGEARCRDSAHLTRSYLSFMAGESLYLTGAADRVATTNRIIAAASDAIDQIIQSPTVASLDACLLTLATLRAEVQEVPLLASEPGAAQRYVAVIEALSGVLIALRSGDFRAACRITNESRKLIDHWGIPGHFAVFRRMPDA